ncbi:MAG TPA: ATP-binding protein, partial [Chitinophagaceae bacterium]|nr:ATP-binding protein [Chitinophagaceae bacterium]
LNNAVKYSGTERIAVSTGIQNRALVLEVRDEGEGFDTSLVQKGNGLDNIKNRAAELGGKLEIDSTPGEGTLVKLSMPVPG